MKKVINKYPILSTLFFLAIGFWFIWWMNQPITVIYDSNGPLYWWNDDAYH